MRGFSITPRALVLSIVATGAACGLELVRWPQQPGRVVWMAVLTLAATLASSLAPRNPGAAGRAPMPLSFVVAFASLFLVGPEAMAFIATTAAGAC